MRDDPSLFRSEAIEARRSTALGEIVLAASALQSWLAVALVLAACSLVALAGWGSYTARQTLTGRVVAQGGVVEVVSPQAGIVVAKHATEGDVVAVGDILYVVSGERVSSAVGATQEAVREQLLQRRASLIEQIANTEALERTERAALEGHLAALARETRALELALHEQRARLRNVTESAARYAQLRALGYVADEISAAKNGEVLDQRVRLRGMERERAAHESQVADLEGRAASLGLRYGNDLAELRRAIGYADLEIAENEAQRTAVVTASRAGLVTALVGEVGQFVEHGAPLAALVPSDATLLAELYAPSRAVGFVSTGDPVRLRYAAFPYQKFGHARGTVTSVSATGLAGTSEREPLYRVTVALEEAFVDAYGESRRLMPAMAVEADVLLETRRLYEWAFEPLYAVAGRVGAQ
jgi:membrane fusion protein